MLLVSFGWFVCALIYIFYFKNYMTLKKQKSEREKERNTVF